MNLDEVKFTVYTDAIKRTRWFLLITTLLSCMLLIHMYLERFSYQEHQYVDTLKARARVDKEGELKDKEKQIKDDLAKDSRDLNKLSNEKFEALVNEYAELKYSMTVFDNLLKEASIPNRSIPLLNMSIPGNDFLSVIGIMLLIFVIGVWLNIRTVLAAVQSLQPNNSEEMRELIRLHFTFTGLVDHAEMERKVVPIVQYAAFVLPFFSLLIAIILDIYSMISAWLDPYQGNAGPMGVFILQTLIMLVVLFLLFIFTSITVRKVTEIGRITGDSTAPPSVALLLLLLKPLRERGTAKSE